MESKYLDIRKTNGEFMILPVFNLDYSMKNLFWITFGWLNGFIRIKIKTPQF